MSIQLPYFYEPALQREVRHFTLSEDSSRHAVQVLRMKEQDELLLTDGRGLLAKASIMVAHKKHCQAVISDTQQCELQPASICLAISPTKNIGRLEWLLEKITEIGVTDIWLMTCERSERTTVKRERLHQILVSAMLQSRQVHLPNLSELLRFTAVIEQAPQFEQKWIAHCLEDGEKQSLKRTDKSKSQLILIGPEGDFSQKEIELALANQFIPVSLGPTRLRTETAGLVATVLLNF